MTWGDWGTGSALQKDNAAQINAWCKTPGACSMVVGLADNFYVRLFLRVRAGGRSPTSRALLLTTRALKPAERAFEHLGPAVGVRVSEHVHV